MYNHGINDHGIISIVVRSLTVVSEYVLLAISKALKNWNNREI